MILITAFEPFGGKERNASAEALRLLPEKIGGHEVRKMMLPVVFGEAAEHVLQQQAADAVFMLGEAGNRGTVTPEIQAVNLRDARIPDNAGNQPKGEKILQDGPETFRSRISIRRIVYQLQEEGYSAAVSEDAGTFVCNDTFYLTGVRYPALTEFIRDGHGADHTLRVYRNALWIAETEPEADRFIVSLGALLHDADDAKLFQTEGNANARQFLEKQGVFPETADLICQVINGVSFSKNGDRRPETIEGMIVQDADRLDAIGAIGIARTFAYGAKHNRTGGDSIAHFHEKLLLLKDRMNTSRGRKMAEPRHAFLELFLKEWEKENQ